MDGTPYVFYFSLLAGKYHTIRNKYSRTHYCFSLYYMLSYDWYLTKPIEMSKKSYIFTLNLVKFC